MLKKVLIIESFNWHLEINDSIGQTLLIRTHLELYAAIHTGSYFSFQFNYLHKAYAVSKLPALYAKLLFSDLGQRTFSADRPF